MTLALRGSKTKFYFQSDSIKDITKTMIKKRQEVEEDLELFVLNPDGTSLKISDTRSYQTKSGQFLFNYRFRDAIAGGGR